MLKTEKPSAVRLLPEAEGFFYALRVIARAVSVMRERSPCYAGGKGERWRPPYCASGHRDALAITVMRER